MDGLEFYKDAIPLKMINGLGQDGNGMLWIDVRLPEGAPEREVLCARRAAHELARHPVIIGTFLHKVEDACVALGTEPFTSAS